MGFLLSFLSRRLEKSNNNNNKKKQDKSQVTVIKGSEQVKLKVITSYLERQSY